MSMSMDTETTVILAGSTTCIILLIILITYVIVLCRRRPPIVNHPRRNRNLPNSDLISVTVTESAYFDPSICEISMAELIIATKNFSSDLIVGDGSFGFVYRAELSNGVVVAVKKLDPDALQGFREFSAEMETLGQLNHPNIVRILGYCISGQERVLIYEFLEKRSLDYWLHETADHDGGDDDDDDDENGSLTWSRRVSITHDVAKGLAYLHGLAKPIIHRDIKSSNVLLDSDFVAHIADFGLARSMDASMSHVSTQVAGTMGYMPPEYWGGYTAATVKADVYSFGVLMLEMATRRRPNWPVVVDEKEVGLAQWAVMMVGQNRYYEMVDFEVIGSEKGVEEYFRIACLCIRESTRQRPTMSQVVELLEKLCLLI
ncbi:Phytosulfokine receptor 1 [Cardamine amara subsp. amara]|uniref:Phytosulfokine receptor 1 n=1 Tax=Cardamine amara subsp. amara TaxID=228776 RepID=A0ABD1BSA4_CARAN